MCVCLFKMYKYKNTYVYCEYVLEGRKLEGRKERRREIDIDDIPLNVSVLHPQPAGAKQSTIKEGLLPKSGLDHGYFCGQILLTITLTFIRK